MNRLSRSKLALVVLALSWAPAAWADEPLVFLPLPDVLKKPVPESLDELRAMEKQVQAVVKKVMPCTVGVRIGPGQGSGVIVSPDGFVITAGHVSGKPGQDAIIVMPDGKQLKGKTLGRNGGIDSGMIKIQDEGPFPYTDMGKSSEIKAGNWCIAIGHPGGYRTNRAPVVRLGRVLIANSSFLRTDCTLVNGDSGGPLFDLQGRVIGIHSRIAGPITMNIHVPVDTYRQTWDRLAKGESFGGQLGRPVLVASAGGKIVLEEKGKITKEDPKDKKMDSHHKVFTFKFVPGSAYTLDLVSRDFDSFLRLEDPNGVERADNDDGGGQLHSRIVYRPSREGVYRIVVTSFEPGQVGAFTFTIKQAEISTKDLASGKVDVLEAMKVPRPVVTSLVGQLAKAGVSLYANANLFDEEGRPISSREVTFQWKNGKHSGTTDDQGQIRLELNRDKIEELFLDVPQGLKASVQIIDEDGNPPPLRLGKKKAPTAAGKLVFKKEASLQISDPLDKLLKRSHHQVHNVKVTGGKSYTIDLESIDFDAFLRLEDANGKTLAQDDDGGGDLNSRVVYRPAADDEVRIIVTSFDGGKTGNYTLTVHEAN